MNFNEQKKQGKIKKVSFNKALFESLMKTSEQDLKYLESVKLTELSARKTMTNYYDVLRSYLEALGLQHNCKIYTHEAYTYFLKEIKQDVLALKFDRLRKIRNNINYYGEDTTVEEAEENIQTTKELITKIIKIIQKTKKK